MSTNLEHVAHSNLSKCLLFNKVTVLLLFFTCSILSPALAQETNPKTFLQVKLKDKRKFKGQLISKTKDSLIINTANSKTIRLHRDSIRYSYKLQSGEFRDGKYSPDIVNPDKGYVAPTGFGPRKGEVYFENTMLVWSELNAGLTDHVSLRIGFDTYSFVEKITSSDYYYVDEGYDPAVLIATKFSHSGKSDKWHLGLTTAVVNEPDNKGFFDHGVVFLSSTWGTRNNNFTIGLGTQIFGGDQLFNNTFLTLSASIRFGHGVSLITENWLVRENSSYSSDYYGVINSLGIKIIGKKTNWSITVVRIDNDYFFPAPVIGVAFPISKSWGS